MIQSKGGWKDWFGDGHKKAVKIFKPPLVHFQAGRCRATVQQKKKST